MSIRTIVKHLAGFALLSAAFTLSSGAYAQVSLNLATGWNLLGNSSAAPIDVAATFGDATKITTVWSWNKATSKWAFYAPSMTASALPVYAQGKGYDVLTSINSKEGFWVNASTAVALTGPAANGVTLIESDLQQGWNLVGSADNKTSSQLNQGLNSSLNAAGKAIVTAWAWDAPNAKWKFYAPSLEAQAGTVLPDYIASKDYVSFGSVLSAADGFWLNIGAASNPFAALFAASVTDTTADINATRKENGYVFYIVQPAATAAPSVLQIYYGRDGNDGTALKSGSADMPANTQTTFSFTFLRALTNYTAYFGTMDSSYKIQAGVHSVAVATTRPTGYVDQGGLTWMPIGSSFGSNSSSCAYYAPNGQTGWRMPTMGELQSLYNSGAMNGKGWTLYRTWSSTAYTDEGNHYYLDLRDGAGNWGLDGGGLAVSCVHEALDLWLR